MQRQIVSVMIAAYNAEDTLALAVESALAEPEVGEVIVIDDCSGDGTVLVAKELARRDDRVIVLRQPRNQGPAAARNRALDAATMPFVCVLDADDCMMGGRLARLVANQDWDFCADNIYFAQGREEMLQPQVGQEGCDNSVQLNLCTFLAGNHSSSRVDRTELGFLKPVMRKALLDAHGLRYDLGCRLGEDFLLYCRALLLGARFTLHEACGYLAEERPNSLSASHSIEDLRNLLHGIEAIAAAKNFPAECRPQIAQICAILRRKISHREVLRMRQEEGLPRALAAMLHHPTVARDILRDKLRLVGDPQPKGRLLVSAASFEELAR